MIKDGWYCCPYCGKRLFKVIDGAKCQGVEIKCNGIHKDGAKCRRIVQVNI